MAERSHFSRKPIKKWGRSVTKVGPIGHTRFPENCWHKRLCGVFKNGIRIMLGFIKNPSINPKRGGAPSARRLAAGGPLRPGNPGGRGNSRASARRKAKGTPARGGGKATCLKERKLFLHWWRFWPTNFDYSVKF